MAEETDLCGQNVERRSGCAVIRKGERGRVKDDGETVGKTDDLFVGIDPSSRRRIIRSVFEIREEKTDLCGPNVERRSSRTLRASTTLGKGDGRPHGMEDKHGNIGKTDDSCVEMVRNLDIRVTRSASKTRAGETDVHGQNEGRRRAYTSSKDVGGVKRKRMQAAVLGTDCGWTKEQELALQNAYFAAKPSPHFWKKVSKLVPGKSAQDCFDKVHSDSLTPLSTRRSSKVKKQDSPSVLSYSESKLFESAEKKSKRTCKTKHKSHLARLAVRHLRQKICHVNQDDEADLFSVLEPTVNPSVEAIQLNAVQLTPRSLFGTPGSYSKYLERSSSGHKNCLCRYGGIRKSPLTCPIILKKVKNMALHEKYIDKLHIRDAKRKVPSACYSKLLGPQNPAETKDVIRASRDSLVSEARDVIGKFRDSQANLMEAFSDSEGALNSDEGEDERVL